MPIDIDGLTEAQLTDLNNRIVARLKFLHEAKLHARMLDFSIGEKVTFHPQGYAVQFGVIVKYNRKTVTLITEAGQQWNVAPVYLRKLTDVTAASGPREGAQKLEKL